MNSFGICLQTLIPIRIHPSERAEMTTQLLFGESYSIIELSGNWAKIFTSFDSYEGWIDKKLITYINEDDFNKYTNSSWPNCQKIISPIHNTSKNSILPLVAGSSLPGLKSTGNLELNNNSFHYKHKILQADLNGENVAIIAKQFTNAPYLWGGRTILGIDCSGLSQIAYKIAGVSIKRDASQQIEHGTSINFISEAKPGDLAFFDNDEGNIIHVGIMLNPNQIIHASGWVRIDRIDHQGIYNADINKYSHKLRVIKRLF